MTTPSLNHLASPPHWLIRYKLYHIPFWAIYHYCFWILATGSPLSLFQSPYFFKFVFYVIFQAIGVYFNLYFLIPRFLEKGRYGIYLFYFLLTVFCTALLIIPGYHLSAWWAGKPFQEAFQREPTDILYFLKANSLPSTLASMTLGMSVKLTKNWIQSRRREELLEKEKLETELKFLRAQFNPHFLFNSINSIFVLINKNPTLASEALAKFSDLLRYQLYECNEPKIPLQQELNYLRGFIELEKLRQDSNFSLSTTWEEDKEWNLSIAPFVLIPFVENAFKHVSQSKSQPNWVDIKLKVTDLQLNMEVTNTTTHHAQIARELVPRQGLGLKNVQRRLDLVYPGQHDLTIDKTSETFKVSLTLQLHREVLRNYSTQRVEL